MSDDGDIHTWCSLSGGAVSLVQVERYGRPRVEVARITDWTGTAAVEQMQFNL